jgi:uncharacterized protein
MTRARRVAASTAVALVLLAGCGSDADTPAGSSPTTGSSSGDLTGSTMPVAAGRQPEGFTTIQARITEPDGAVCEVCLWLADDSEERGRGLMGVTDLGDADGMAFVFDEPTIGAFWMFDTPTPLSIAWFAPDGEHVGSADMSPCVDTPANECPLYAPDAEYDLAIEVFEGGLEPLGLGPGARVELLDGTESERCPATP